MATGAGNANHPVGNRHRNTGAKDGEATIAIGMAAAEASGGTAIATGDSGARIEAKAGRGVRTNTVAGTDGSPGIRIVVRTGIRIVVRSVTRTMAGSGGTPIGAVAIHGAMGATGEMANGTIGTVRARISGAQGAEMIENMAAVAATMALSAGERGGIRAMIARTMRHGASATVHRSTGVPIGTRIVIRIGVPIVILAVMRIVIRIGVPIVILAVMRIVIRIGVPIVILAMMLRAGAENHIGAIVKKENGRAVAIATSQIDAKSKAIANQDAAGTNRSEAASRCVRAIQRFRRRFLLRI
jgi:hypothetical protein